ncbi:hypothetical protein Btru_035820 [Bulinus truncatus]|nr:hypothetical protein Btru_035820 [Bulinus truncatus]
MVIDSKKSSKVKKRQMHSKSETVSPEKKMKTEQTECGSTGVPPSGKKNKKDKTTNEDSTLGQVDTSILQQTGINLGLPVSDTDGSPAVVTKEKKKKRKKSNPESPAEKNKIERSIEYLRTWNTNRKEWKFNKMYQVHLFHVMYDKSLLNEEDFEILLLYIEGLKGKSRDQTREEAEKIINSDKADGESSNLDKEERARQIIQILS